MGLATTDAETEITDAGLTVGAVSEAFSDTVPAGDVSSQDPAPDTMVDVGTAVAYTVSLGIEQVEVPELVGLTAAEAEDAATALGLAVSTTEVETGDVEPGIVLDQDPDAGSTVDIGSTVRLAVAVPLPQVADRKSVV